VIKDHTNTHGGMMINGTRMNGRIEKMMMITGTNHDQLDGEVTRVHHAEAGKRILRHGKIHNGTNQVAVGTNHRPMNAKKLQPAAVTRIPRLTEHPYHEDRNHLHNHQQLGNERAKGKNDHLRDVHAKTEHNLNATDGHQHHLDPGARDDNNQFDGTLVERDKDHRHQNGDHRRHEKDHLFR